MGHLRERIEFPIFLLLSLSILAIFDFAHLNWIFDRFRSHLGWSF
ncbi:unnamed protein product [Acidithrix sp. C25]|nr:unnamed protein product [Acidithrix sp. C25]